MLGEHIARMLRKDVPFRGEVIVCHPDSLRALARSLLPEPISNRDLWGASMGPLFGLEVIACPLLPRWVVEWAPPDWGPLWELGPEDEASLRPAGFGVMAERVGKPAFWAINRLLIDGYQPRSIHAHVWRWGRRL